MKLTMTIIALTIFSMNTFANSSITKVCRSDDGATSVTVTYKYGKTGLFSGKAIINGVELKETNSKAFPTLAGWTTGDMDNYQTYQLTLIDTDNGQDAILISQDHVDRVGLFNTVTNLTCK